MNHRDAENAKLSGSVGASMTTDSTQPAAAPRSPFPATGSRLPFYAADHGELYVADCLDVLPELPSDAYDAVVTDPPYSSGGRNQAEARGRISKNDADVRDHDEWFLGDNMGSDTYIRWMRQIARECLRCVIQGGHAYIFTDWRQYTNLVTAWESVGCTLRSVLVWDKAKGGAMGSFWRGNHEWVAIFTKGQPNPPAHHSCYNTWTGTKPQAGEHPTEKPLGLLNYIVRAIPRKKGKLLDCFAGSGTTLVAAKLNGFKATGIERMETYAQIAKARWSQEVLPLNSASEGPERSAGTYVSEKHCDVKFGRANDRAAPMLKGARDEHRWSNDEA